MGSYSVVVASGAEVMESGRVDPSHIADQIRDIGDQLGDVFKQPLGLPLKSMEVALTITAEGSVGFLGTGAKAGAEASITLTFEKAAPGKK